MARHVYLSVGLLSAVILLVWIRHTFYQPFGVSTWCQQLVQPHMVQPHMAPTNCSAAEALRQSKFFKAAVAANGRWSACPSATWLEKMRQADNGVNKVFLDIGCNKGYTSAELFNLWAPSTSLTANFMYKALVALDPKAPDVCGACHDCKDLPSLMPPVDALGSVTVHCFEPSKPNFRRLEKIKETVFPTNNTAVQWHLYNTVVSNVSGISLPFPSDCKTEMCSLSAAGNQTDDIPAVTVDSFLKEQEIWTVDLLKIDTEGFDPAALQGAEQSLRAGRIKVLLFEYHAIGLWQGSNLADIASRLDSYGFACYFTGQPTLTRINGGCWNEAYEFHNWSNVLCILTEHPLYPSFEALSFRAHIST